MSMSFSLFSLSIYLILLLQNVNGACFYETVAEMLFNDTKIEQQTGGLTQTDPNFQYGQSIAVSGRNLVITARLLDVTPGGVDLGGAWIWFEQNEGMRDWKEVKFLTIHDNPLWQDYYGTDCDIDGRTVVVSSSLRQYIPTDPSGAVFVYYETTENEHDWTKIAEFRPLDDWGETDTTQFGTTVSMTNGYIFCNTYKDFSLAMGSETGAVYIYEETSPQNWVPMHAIFDPSPVAFDHFGFHSDVDGINVAVGANYKTPDAVYRAGAAYIFKLSGTWLLDATIKAPIAMQVENAYFGSAVSISGSLLVVSAREEDVSIWAKAGAAYVYAEMNPGTGDWSFLHRFQSQSPTTSGMFGGGWDGFDGVAVDESSGHLLIGEWYGNLNGYRSGNLFFYKLNATNEFEYQFDITDNYPSSWSLIGQNVRVIGNNVFTASNNGGQSVTPGAHHVIDCADDCIGHACEHGATCVDEWENYNCVCGKIWSGELCTECKCNNAGCDDEFADACNCTGSGATGKWCNTDIDDCSSSPCLHGGTCTDNGALLFPLHANEYNCSCEGTGYHGPTCNISDCDITSLCMNDGVCINVDGGIACNCNDTGYFGSFCETEINECDSSPCFNDGGCMDALLNYTCDCLGTCYHGPDCSVDVDDCASSPCQNGGTCEDRGACKWRCTCPPGYEGADCTTDVDECILNADTCANGALCLDDAINVGQVICNCSNTEYTGENCTIPVTTACIDHNPCLNGGKCDITNTNEMHCDCEYTGFDGDICQTFIYFDECISSPCENGGTCYDPTDADGDWYCECVVGYSGKTCTASPCDSMPCQNGASCNVETDTGEWSCTCADSYTGNDCSIPPGGALISTSSEGGWTSSGAEENPPKNNDPTLVGAAVGGGTGAFSCCCFALAFFFWRKRKIRLTFELSITLETGLIYADKNVYVLVKQQDTILGKTELIQCPNQPATIIFSHVVEWPLTKYADNDEIDFLLCEEGHDQSDMIQALNVKNCKRPTNVVNLHEGHLLTIRNLAEDEKNIEKKTSSTDKYAEKYDHKRMSYKMPR